MMPSTFSAQSVCRLPIGTIPTCSTRTSAGAPAVCCASCHSKRPNRHVSCEPRALDRHGRTVALCRADGRDLGADMVADGHAWAFVRDSRDYVDEEREAAAVRAGIHGHTCEPAWLWRSERRKNQPIMSIGP